MLLSFNQSVAAVFTLVDNACLVCFRVDEHEEVVAEEVHLQNRFFAVHRLQRKALLPDDLRFFVFFLLRHCCC